MDFQVAVKVMVYEKGIHDSQYKCAGDCWQPSRQKLSIAKPKTNVTKLKEMGIKPNPFVDSCKAKIADEFQI